MNNREIVIIGAGPSGLSAAYELVKQGVPPIVLEKSTQVGGIARTETYKGYRFDVGGHRFYTKNKEIASLWQEILGDDLLKISRQSRILYRGKLYHYPLQLSDLYKKLGIIEVLLIGLSYLNSRFFPFQEEKTLEQWICNRFGNRLYHTFFKVYSEKIWGIPCHDIGSDWGAQRIKGLSLPTIIAGVFHRTPKVKSLIGQFSYPREGSGMMWQSLLKQIEGQKKVVRFLSEVVSISHLNGSMTDLIYLEQGRSVSVPVREVISSIPLTRLVSLLDPAPPDSVLKAAAQLKYRDIILIGLILRGKNPFPDQWLYINEPGVRVGRIQNFKNWSASMSSKPDGTGIGMEYFCSRKDEIWNSADANLAGMAAMELQSLGLANAEAVIDSHVIRQVDAYPVYNLSYRRPVAVIREFLGSFNNLYTVGRNGTHQYNNMDHSMLAGLLAARNIMGGNHDLWDVNTEGEYLEEHKWESKAG